MSTDCEVRRYEKINPYRRDVILRALKKEGATLTGSNPYDADMNRHGVKLHGSWNGASNVLEVAVADKNFYVSCAKVWEAIDPMVVKVQGMEEPAPLPSTGDPNLDAKRALEQVGAGTGDLSPVDQEAFGNAIRSLDSPERTEGKPAVYETEPGSGAPQATVAGAPPSGLGTKIMIGAGILGLAAWWWKRRS